MASERAMVAKDKGNAAFKAGDYPTAVGHYTAAILADGTDPTFPLNRAAAYLKLGKSIDAERDSTTVLRLNPSSAKAYFRRGQARFSQGQLTDARDDFKNTLKLEPNNESVKQELAKLENAIAQGKAKQRATEDVDYVQKNSLITPQQETEKTGNRRRIPIRIVEDSASEMVPSTLISQPQRGEDLLKPVYSRRVSANDSSPQIAAKTMSATSPVTKTFVDKKDTFQSAKSARNAKGSRTGGGIFRPSGNHTIFVRDTTNPPLNEVNKPSMPPSKPTPALSKSIPTLNELPTPVTLFHFTKAWESLQHDDDRWELLLRVSPASIPSIFQTSLEAPILASLVQTFLHILKTKPDDDTATPVKEYMKWLSKVPRFATVKLFLSREEKQVAREVVELLGGDDWLAWRV